MGSVPEFCTNIEQLWSWISRAPQSRKHLLRSPTVITTMNGIPNARTMILREVVHEQFVFFTDKRSQKIEELRCNPNIVIHSYSHNKRLQMVMMGTMNIIQEHSSMERWKQQGLSRFSDYGYSVSPGTVLPPNLPPPDYETAQREFCVLLANIASIEILKLSSPAHHRMMWKKIDSQWHLQHLVP